VPDNPRALIAQPDRYEPQVNETVLDFCRHYDVSMLPARPYSPQDKARVASAVQVVERWILARLRHERLADVAAADRAVGGLLAMLNGRRFQKLEATRVSLFAALDAPALPVSASGINRPNRSRHKSATAGPTARSRSRHKPAGA
jgi:hypothetical protein